MPFGLLLGILAASKRLISLRKMDKKLLFSIAQANTPGRSGFHIERILASRSENSDNELLRRSRTASLNPADTKLCENCASCGASSENSRQAD